ncbi:Lactase-phlorizin hydrolase [Papilio xuthus]|uniref:beta-glucosidase n=1 Tax=Papilio xuthus TaxID=66420 RepID=A0A194PP18_PAPXU|nr:Lactase-phlorizin hydrolase [Papilio xuthus]
MQSQYYFITVIVTALWFRVEATRANSEVCFPPHFMFGVATAAYQIEGAWNISGKGESIWDRYTHTHPERIFDHKTGDVAADSYHRVKEDVRLLVALGVHHYRFSISWPRILPTGLSNDINEDGIRYYSELVDQLLAKNIVPMVTLYHWDLPQALQDLGGWTNPIIAEYFHDYAKIVFEHLSDRVKVWFTFNEPLSFCQEGYGGTDAPGGNSSGFEDYLCGHNVLRAHASVYRMFERDYRHTGGAVGIVLDFAWMEPASTALEDQKAAETARQFQFGWFAHPIFSPEGDYPPVMKQRINEISKRQNFPRSRLPVFTQEELVSLRGSSDFLGLNHYTTCLVAAGNGKIYPQPSFYTDMGVLISQNPDWPRTNSTWLRVVPWGFRRALNYIRVSYNNPPVLVTENGVSLPRGTHDLRRVQYAASYLRAMHQAMQDGCDVRGYTHWSLIDNFEWTRGYSERFGLYDVNYASSARTRTPRLSARFYAKLTRTRCLPDSWE